MRPRLGIPLSISLLVIALLLLGSAPSSAQYFGKNKVHYKDFKWQVIKTAHFEVYFYEGERLCALDAARMAERSYAKLSRVLGYEMTRPIPVILYASHTDFQQTNVTTELLTEGTGGFTEFLKRRVLLPFTGSYAELDHVLTHELVHAFQVEILFGANGNLLSNPVTLQPPLWLMEGMAEYLSLGGVDVHTEMWLRDAALQGYLIPIDILSMAGDIRVYRFGQSIFTFIGTKFGDEKIGEILKATARLGGVGSAVKSALGMSLEELSEAWLEETRKTYLPQIVNYRKASEFAKRLTHQGEDLSQMNLAPCISPDGDRVAFISDRSMYTDIYVADAGTGESKKRLVKGERSGGFESLRFFNTALAWSADGKSLAFPAKVGGEDAIYVMDVEKKKIREKLTFGLDGILSPSFSPDGSRIVFVGLDGGASDLFICDTNGKNVKRLTTDRFTDRDPQFSPDGKVIAFTTDRGEATDFDKLVFGNFRIGLYRLDNGDIKVLPNQKGKNIAPQWSPDGTEIMFVSDRTGVSNVYSIDIASGDVYQLTNILTGVTGIVPSAPPISLSRNGERLVFSAFDGAGWDIYSIDDPFALKGEPLREETQIVAADSVAGGGTNGDTNVAPVPASQEVYDLADVYPEADRPPPLEAPLPTAPGALPDSSTFEVSRYKIHFTQDFLAGGAAFSSNVGFAGQTALAFSDILGNHNIIVAASVYGSISDSEILLAYQNLKGRLNYGVSFFQFRNDFFIYSAQDQSGYQSQVYRGLEFQVSYPLSKFERLEFGMQGVAISSRLYDEFVIGPAPTEPVPSSTEPLYYLQPSIVYVKDNALFGSTGPIQGTRIRLSLEQALGDLQYTTGIADLRNCLNIRHRYTIATRLIAGFSDGGDPQAFRIGGAYTFRGADYGAMRGSRIGIANIEFRYPLIDRLKLGFPPLDFRGIRGVFFLDLASSWRGNDFRLFGEAPNGSRRLDSVRGAYGLGARVNLGYFVLRYDIAWPTDFYISDDPIDFITLSTDF